MSASFDWELRRMLDGEVIDRATSLYVLHRAAWQSMRRLSSLGRGHLILHVPSGEIVARWRQHTWRIDARALERIGEPL